MEYVLFWDRNNLLYWIQTKHMVMLSGMFYILKYITHFTYYRSLVFELVGFSLITLYYILYLVELFCPFPFC